MKATFILLMNFHTRYLFILCTYSYYIDIHSKSIRHSGDFNSNPVKWFNRDLEALRSTLHVLETVARSSGTEENWKAFRQFRSCYRREVQRAKSAAYNNYITSSSNKSRSCWKIINHERGQNAFRDSGSDLNSNDFNSFFTSVAQRISNALPPKLWIPWPC